MLNLKYEGELFNKGIKLIAGVDEVGRGALAGPLVVAAVILNIEQLLSTINDVESFYGLIQDSKTLSPKVRTYLSEKIIDNALSHSLVSINNSTLDKIGLSKATFNAFNLAVESLSMRPQHILTDLFAVKNFSKDMQSNITKGDSLSITVGAASIIAKVYRDDLMVGLHKKYPVYGLNKHKGYGTLKHIQAIKTFGPCKIHRKTFEPIKSLTDS